MSGAAATAPAALPPCLPPLAERLAQVHNWTEADGSVPSPCIGVCKMDEPRNFCIGCLRTLDELRAWRSLGDGDKHAVWQLIAQRAAGIP